MWWRLPYNPGPYDDDWEDQPAQSGFHKWGLGVCIPAIILAYGIWILATQTARFYDNQISLELHGYNADAYAVAVIAAALFLHCHYFWGNVYNQAWFAVAGKIIAACAFVAGLAFLCIRVGILGRG